MSCSQLKEYCNRQLSAGTRGASDGHVDITVYATVDLEPTDSQPAAIPSASWRSCSASPAPPSTGPSPARVDAPPLPAGVPVPGLITRTTGGIFRDLMTDSTVGTISAAFQDEGFAPNPGGTYQDTSVRRETTQAYLEAVDWTDPAQVSRLLRAAERLLHGWEPQYLSKFWQSLRRDGYNVEEATGQISTLGPALAIDSLAKITDPSAIREQMDRIRRAANDDPALAIGTAKELIESTAKVVLLELGHHVDEKADLPELARAAQLALGLDLRRRRRRRRTRHQ